MNGADAPFPLGRLDDAAVIDGGPQHGPGYAVPQLMGVDMTQPSASVGSLDNIADTAGGQRAMRCMDADKDASAIRRRTTAAAQV